MRWQWEYVQKYQYNQPLAACAPSVVAARIGTVQGIVCAALICTRVVVPFFSEYDVISRSSLYS